MNLFNEAIYKNHLEHTAEGTKWGKHKYLYITPSGRYVYPEDVANGRSQSDFRRQQINDQIKSAHQGVVARGKANIARSRQINDQIKSAHQGEVSRNPEDMRKAKALSDMSGMKLSATHKLNRLAKEKGTNSKEFKEELKILSEGDKEQAKKMLGVINGKNSTAKTSGVAAGSKSVASNAANRNTVTIKSEEKKTESTTSTSTEDKGKYKNMSEETKAWLEKEASKGEKKEEDGTKKGSGGKKGVSGKKKGSSSKATKTEEQKQMGLSDDDLKKMEVNTDATNRDEVLKNIALRVIRGDYGNGADRKAKLGNYYDEVQKRVNEIMKEGNLQREGQSQQQTESKKSQSANTASSSSKESSNRKYKQELYKEGDKDFDDSKYNESTRLGNTDFHAYKRDDGKYVILEEDMKWVVDEKPSTKMIKNLEAMDEYIKARQKNGTWHSKNASKEWDELASIAINGGDLTKRAEAEKAKVKNNKKTVKHDDLERGMFLMHFGNRNSGRYRRGTGDRPYQHESGRHMRKNSTFSDRRSMTDEELGAAINRIKKEADLYRMERDNRSQGQRFVEEVLSNVAKDAAKGGLKYIGRKVVADFLENPELANAMFGGGGGGKKKDKKKK